MRPGNAGLLRSFGDPFPPTQFSYKADNPAIVIATGVSSWPDSLGLKTAAAQGAAGKQPALLTLNSRPAVHFDGVDDYLFCPAYVSVIPQPFTIACVGEFTGAAIGAFFDGIDGINRAALFPGYNSGPFNAQASGFFAASAIVTAGPPGGSLLAPFVAVVVFNGVSSKYYINGTLVASGNPGNAGTQGLAMGVDATQVANFLSGYAQEYSCWSGDQSAQVAVITNFRKSYWNQ